MLHSRVQLSLTIPVFLLFISPYNTRHHIRHVTLPYSCYLFVHLTHLITSACQHMITLSPYIVSDTLVYMSLYHTCHLAIHVTLLLQLAKARWSTGTPGLDRKPTAQCLYITEWIGGNLYIRVDPDKYYPIRYSVSALVKPSEESVASAQLTQVVSAIISNQLYKLC